MLSAFLFLPMAARADGCYADARTKNGDSAAFRTQTTAALTSGGLPTTTDPTTVFNCMSGQPDSRCVSHGPAGTAHFCPVVATVQQSCCVPAAGAGAETPVATPPSSGSSANSVCVYSCDLPDHPNQPMAATNAANCTPGTAGDQTCRAACQSGSKSCASQYPGSNCSSDPAPHCQTVAEAAPSEAGGGAQGGIILPSCVSSDTPGSTPGSAGVCTLQDIINTGIAFANFILGFAGALLLGIFVWGAVYYVIFAYDSGKAQKGKEMIKNAAVGFVLIIVAGTLIRFAVSAIGANVPSSPPSGGGAAQQPTATPPTAPVPPSGGAPAAAAASCHCTGALVLTSYGSIFQSSYCPRLRAQCPDCSDSGAHCTLDFPASATECAGYQSDPWTLAPKMGSPPLTSSDVGSARDMAHAQLTATCTPSGGH